MSRPIAAAAPLWLRIALTAFVAFLVPYYWRLYGPQNFLWLSDAGLFLTVIALWRANRLLISMMAVGVLPLELFWNIDFFSRLVTGAGIGGIADYTLAVAQIVRALSARSTQRRARERSSTAHELSFRVALQRVAEGGECFVHQGNCSGTLPATELCLRQTF